MAGLDKKILNAYLKKGSNELLNIDNWLIVVGHVAQFGFVINGVGDRSYDSG